MTVLAGSGVTYRGDGRVLPASRWDNSLHVIERDGVHDCEICGIPHIHHRPGSRYRAVVIASEPISHEPWHEVPNHSLVVVDADLEVRVRPLDP